MKEPSLKLRKIVLLITASVSLFIFLFLRPTVNVDKYAEKRVAETGGGSDDRSSNWTTSTTGHKIALAVADALSPKDQQTEQYE